MDWIDFIVCGEGEGAMVRLCQRLAQGLPSERILQSLPDATRMTDEGVLYRAGEGDGGILYYESSRGCPYRCAYCLSSAEKGLRQKTVLQTLADLQRFEEIHADCRVIKFVDRTFNAGVKRANEIWRALLSDRFTKHYHFEVCASLLDEESFEILSQMPKGKIQLEFGLQSTNLPTLEAVSRHIDPQKTLAAVDRIHKMGNIHVHLDLIAGLPFEGYARFGQSFDEAYGCCDLLQVGFLKLLYGTALREKMDEYGYVALSKPPYTVLQSKWISFEEMQRLFHLAETLERYRESGRFEHTLWYLQGVVDSQFAFWTGVTEYLRVHDSRQLQKISQPDAYRYLLEFASEQEGIDQSILKSMLAADFEQHEHKNAPAFLQERK
jgi:radical SAM superfamily enzyme